MSPISTSTTNQEWTVLIQETSNKLSISQKDYPCPAVDSPAFAKTIDHTLLNLDAAEAQIDVLCEEAGREGFATVCVRPNFVARAVENLKGSGIGVASVIGFHEGTYSLEHKLQETTLSLHSGATELDLVLNYPLLYSRPSDNDPPNYRAIFDELHALRTTAPSPTILKLILETSQLSRAETIAACTLAAAANFDFVKTSTGFKGAGASEENVRLMRACCEGLTRGRMRVKASGGVRSLGQAMGMLRAGAERLGVSAGVTIVKEGKEGKEGKRVEEGVVVGKGY